MKPMITLVIISLAATLFGCNDDAAPKSEVRVESASEAARNDNLAIAGRLAQQKAAVDEAYARERFREQRQRYVDALRSVNTNWDQGLDEASRTARSKVAGAIKKLQAIKSDAELVEVDECTGGARATLVSSMTASIEALSLFQKETGTGGEASGLKLQLAADLLFAAQREMNACLRN